MGRVPVGIRPQSVCQQFLAHIAAAQGEQDLEEFERFFLNLAAELDRRIIEEQAKPTQGVDFDGIGPLVGVLVSRGAKPMACNDLFDINRIDVVLQGEGAEAGKFLVAPPDRGLSGFHRCGSGIWYNRCGS